MDNNMEILEQKIVEAYGTGDVEQVYGLVKEVLELEPDIPEALLLLADVSSDEEEALSALRKARQIMISQDGEAILPESEDGQLLADILERLAALLLPEDAEQALVLARELEAFDPDEDTWARIFIYSSLLRLGRHSKVLEETLRDASEDAPRFYSRVLALFSLAGITEESMTALWDAFRVDSDIPFYMLSFWPEPAEEDSDEEWEFYHMGSILSLPWVENQEALAWLTSAAVSFGYLTDRLPEGFIDEIHTELEEAGMIALFEQMDASLHVALGDEEDPSQETLDRKALEILAGTNFLNNGANEGE